MAAVCGQLTADAPPAAGEAIEAYWPDDDTWLPATISATLSDGSLSIIWADDGSGSDVPADYVRRPQGGGCGNDEAVIADHEEAVAEAEETFVEDTMGEHGIAAGSEVAEDIAPMSTPCHGRPLARLRGAQRDMRPAWMTKGLGIGTAMFGEATGELLKPGLTKKALEEIEQRGRDSGPDPFGEIFGETSSGRAALDRLDDPPSKPTESFAVAFEGSAASEAQDVEQLDPVFVWEETVSFDGTPATALDVPHSPAQNPAGSFSVDFWVKPGASGSGYRSPVTSRDFPPPRGYAFFITPKGRWAFWIGLPENKEWLKLEGTSAESGRWQRLTGTYCAKARSMKFWVDGEKVASTSVLASTRTAFQPNGSRPLRLGAGATEGVAKFAFHGDVCGLRVYNRALDELPPSSPADGGPTPLKKAKH